MRYPDQSELFSGPAGWLTRVLAVAFAVATILVILAAIRGPQPALADQAKFYLECNTTQVREGGSFDVTLVRVTDHQHDVRFGAFWHTDAGTAGTADYVHQNTGAIWSNESERLNNRMNRTFQTKQDNTIEVNETFTVRFSPDDNVVDRNNPDRDHKCEITIVDDDPHISGLSVVSSPLRDNNTYGAGETIEIEATFNLDVAVDLNTGRPALGLRVGSNWRAADYSRRSASNKLVFAYEVKAEDRDTDGLSMDGGYKDSSGTWHNLINPAAITASNQDLEKSAYRGYSGIGSQASHKVDGSQAPIGTKTEIISSPAKGSIYRYGETIDIAVTFTAPLDVEGSRHLDLRMGDGDAWWRGAAYKSGSGTNTLVFGYTVQSHDRDDTGLAMLGTYTSGGQLHGLGGSGKIKLAGTDTEVYPTFSGLSNQSDHRVDGRPYPKNISITSTPTATDNTYGREEVIQVSVDFGQNVTASASASAILRIGGVFIQGHAAYASGNGTPTLVFEYTVAADDRDSNGVDAFVPHGQDIKATGTNVAYVPNPGGTTPTMGEDPNHRVDGSLTASDTTSPTISSVELTSSYFGDKTAYGAGDRIQATVTFDEKILVTGSPKLKLNIGGQTRLATFYIRDRVALKAPARTVATFQYYAVEGDSDSDGISIAANSLILDGGTIKDEADNDAVLTHSAVADDSDHKVDAPDVTGPTVSSVAITSDPGEDDTYVAGDTIEFSVTFDENIAVTGTPQLTFSLGDGTRTAGYSSHNGATAVFAYTVVIGDTDSDGVSVDSDGLGLNGGTIQDSAGNDASLTINSTIADNPGHKVLAPGGV